MYEYERASAVQRLSRRTAATRPVAWLYARIQPPVDRFVYRRSGGKTTLSSWMADLPIAMLTTTGAKSGARRTHPVLGLADGERLIVIASNYGRPRHPAWYHNLRVHPHASVTIDGVTSEVDAKVLEGAERERCFGLGVEMYPGFRHYERWAGERRIPVIALEPRED